MREPEGFSLVELLVALAIASILLMAIYGTVNVSQKSTSGIERKVAAQQDARAALELMAMEIRMASYDPRLDNGIWAEPANCNNAAPCPRCKGIQEATPNSLTVEMDVDSGGTGTGIVGDGPNEIIRYEYLSDANQLRITRETIGCPRMANPQPFLGDDPASGRPRTVRVVNGAVNVPLFRYFDGSGTEVFPNKPFASNTVQAPIPDIRRIDITLALETEDVDPQTNQRRRLIYSTSVTLKNHAPRL